MVDGEFTQTQWCGPAQTQDADGAGTRGPSRAVSEPRNDQLREFPLENSVRSNVLAFGEYAATGVGEGGLEPPRA